MSRVPSIQLGLIFHVTNEEALTVGILNGDQTGEG